MPLLRRQPFAKQKPPPNLKPDEEVFHCKLTNEIFRDYEQFFERIILCNSLVWSCSITGRSGLTYQEALESEERARKQLATFPDYLQKPILYLATLTYRSRLNDLNDDVFVFARDRFFLGEQVEITVRGDRRPGRITRIIPPGGSPPKTISNGTAAKPVTIDDSDDEDDVICLGEDIEPPVAAKSPGSPSKVKTMGSDPALYQYIVQEKGKLNVHTLKPKSISRRKGLFSRDKCKLYLRLHCDAQGDGVWKVKERCIKRFKLNEALFEDFFQGPKPTFAQSTIKKIPKPKAAVVDITMEKAVKRAKKGKMEGKKEKAKPVSTVSEDTMKKMKMSAEERAALNAQLKEEKRVMKEARREELKERLEEEKARRKEERIKEREKRREEKKQKEELLREWSRPREDMECDDLKPLPVPVPVQLAIPSELFGDLVMVLEYLKCFSDIFDMQEEFPDGLTVDSLSRAVAESEVNGGYFDLIKFLLTAIFNMQAEEEEEIEQEENQGDCAPVNINELLENADDDQDISTKDLIRSATITSQWPHLKYGAPLSKLQMEPFTLTEILRLHFLSSGAKCSDSNSKFRYQQRGGYTSTDDAGLEFRRNEPGIIKILGTENLFDLPAGDKLRILVALVNQLLTFVAYRDVLEENYENLKNTRNDLRQLQQAEQRREKDEATYWYKKKVEERAKEREAEEKRKAERKKLREDRLKLDTLMFQSQSQGLDLKELAAKEGLLHLLTPAISEDAEEEVKDAEESDPKAKETRSTRSKTEPERIKKKVAKEKEEAEKLRLSDTIDWEKVTAEQRAMWKERHLADEAEKIDTIMALQHGYAIYPIGRDRTFRRYWVFQSVPGLFVEDQEEHIPEDCLESVEQTGKPNWFDSENLPLSNCPQNQSGEEKSTSSDKENEIRENGHHMLNGANAVVDGGKPLNSSDLNLSTKDNSGRARKSANVVAMEVDEKSAILTESVQEQVARFGKDPWTFYSSPAQLDKLIESLNPRGIREGPLRTALMEQRDVICKKVQTCPVHLLRNVNDSNAGSGAKDVKYQSLKSRNRVTQGAVQNSSAQELLELNMREMLLDLEERIYAGSLGAIKVNNRPKWREAIESGGYDKQTDALSWSGMPEEQIKTEMQKLEEDEETNQPESEGVSPVVRDLAKAMLQIEQGIDGKYLNPPLGEDESTKKAKQKVALEQAFRSLQNAKKEKKNKDKKKNVDDEDSSSSDGEDDERETEAMKKTALERWEESLMCVTSLPQIFLHLTVLERSISWTKSALHARCRICRRKGDGEHMLLCDSCDRGHHMYCLKPPVKKIPEGDWYCMDCRPKAIVQTPRKARRLSSRVEDSEEEEANSDEEQEEESEEEEEDESEEEEEEDVAVEEAEESEEEDDEDDDDDDEDEEDDEEEEDKKPQPVAIKFLKAKGGRQKSAPSSGRSTPSSIGGRRSKEPAPTEKTSRSRRSLNTSKEAPPAKRSRASAEKPRASTERSRASVEKATRGSRAESASKPVSKASSANAKASNRSRKSDPIPKKRNSNDNVARSGRGSRLSLGSHQEKARTSKRKLNLESDDEVDFPELKKTASKSRGGEEASQMKVCENLVIELSEMDDAWPFNKPVSRRNARSHGNNSEKCQTTMKSSSDPWTSKRCGPTSTSLNTRRRVPSSRTSASSSPTVRSTTCPAPRSTRRARGSAATSCSPSKSATWTRSLPNAKPQPARKQTVRTKKQLQRRSVRNLTRARGGRAGGRKK